MPTLSLNYSNAAATIAPLETPVAAAIKTFVFVFINDTSDDARNHTVCICDHFVAKSEWDDHLETYNDEKDRQVALWQDINTDNIYAHPLYHAYILWRETNHPEVTFRKLHGMQVLEATEFWRT